MSFRKIRCICLFFIILLLVIVIQIWRSQLPTQEMKDIDRGTLITSTPIICGCTTG